MIDPIVKHGLSEASWYIRFISGFVMIFFPYPAILLTKCESALLVGTSTSTILVHSTTYTILVRQLGYLSGCHWTVCPATCCPAIFCPSCDILPHAPRHPAQQQATPTTIWPAKFCPQYVTSCPATSCPILLYFFSNFKEFDRILQNFQLKFLIRVSN